MLAGLFCCKLIVIVGEAKLLGGLYFVFWLSSKIIISDFSYSAIYVQLQHFLNIFFMHSGLFCFAHNPPNPDRYYRISNVHLWSFCTCVHTDDLDFLSHPKHFCRVCTKFGSREIWGWAESLACNGHPDIWRPCSIAIFESECFCSTPLTLFLPVPFVNVIISYVFTSVGCLKKNKKLWVWRWGSEWRLALALLVT